MTPAELLALPVWAVLELHEPYSNPPYFKVLGELTMPFASYRTVILQRETRLTRSSIMQVRLSRCR
jgi:hypothetical protein